MKATRTSLEDGEVHREAIVADDNGAIREALREEQRRELALEVGARQHGGIREITI